VETGNALVTRPGSVLFVSDNYPSGVPSHEVAYTAGFFDGEGCVSIARYLQRGRPYHTLAIIFTNTNFQVLEWLQQRWGGHLTKPTKPSNPRHRPSRNLWLSAGPARPLLLAMLPYLIIKKPQVEIALEFINSRSNNRGRQGDPAATAKRAALAASMPRPRARFNVVNPVFSERQVGGSDSELSEPDAAGAAAPRLVRDAPG
jgi:hypothetical protein